MRVKLKVIKDTVLPMLEAAPELYNDRINRGFRAAGSMFMKVFTQERLSGRPGIRVYRAARRRSGSSTRRIAIPSKARVMGFYGRMKKVRQLLGKEAIMGTRNRQVLTHERGAVITPKRGPFLVLRVRRRSDISAIRNALGISKGKTPKVLRVKRVVIPARLGFETTFYRTGPAMIALVEQHFNGATQLLNQGKFGFRRLYTRSGGTRTRP